MGLRYFNLDEVIGAARSALRPRLLMTMAGTLVGTVVIYGVFNIGGHLEGFGSILLRFIGGVCSLLWTLFGLTALAYQIITMHSDGDIPDPLDAVRFAWTRISSLLMLPAWGAGLLLLLLLGEMLVVLFARIPGIGELWLALVAMPLLLLNTLVALTMILALFNIAVLVATSQQDENTLRDALGRLLRTRFPEVLIYNLGGLLTATIVSAIVLSPLWLGWRITHGIVGYVAADSMQAVIAASGFWAGIAHVVGLVMVGLLVAAVASVPCIVITHLTLLIHKELDATDKAGATKAEEIVVAVQDKKDSPKPPSRNRTNPATKVKSTPKPKPASKPRKPRTKKTVKTEAPSPESE